MIRSAERSEASETTNVRGGGKYSQGSFNDVEQRIPLGATLLRSQAPSLPVHRHPATRSSFAPVSCTLPQQGEGQAGCSSPGDQISEGSASQRVRRGDLENQTGAAGSRCVTSWGRGMAKGTRFRKRGLGSTFSHSERPRLVLKLLNAASVRSILEEMSRKAMSQAWQFPASGRKVHVRRDAPAAAGRGRAAGVAFRGNVVSRYAPQIPCGSSD